MCAIFGIYGEYNPKTIYKMAKCQTYRGPDKTSYYLNKKKKISLGMNRLAVIDRKRGNQPMISYNQRILTIFNGTIYNFKDIRNYLEKKSILFKTNSDTEVLTNSFAFWGDKCFNYFDGMWAAAFYDLKLNTITLSRDFLGQKPLYYYLKKKKLIFSSEIKGIFQHQNDFKISKSNLDLFYKFSHLPAPYTIYKNIFKVRPGQIISIGKKLKKKIFWDLKNGSDYNFFFKKISKNNLKSNFNLNLKNYLISDKRSIIALSSGKDSQVLNNLIKKIAFTPSITVGFKDSSFDESRRIQKKSSSIIKMLSENKIIKIFKNLEKKFIFFNGDGSIIPTYFLFNEIRKKTNVSLSGDGGDEVFFGYITFKAFYMQFLLKKILPNFVLKIIKNSINFKYFPDEYLGNKKKLSIFLNNLDKDLYIVNSYWISGYDNNDIFNITKLKNKHRILLEIKKIYKKKTIMRFAQIYYFKYYLPMVLEKVDYASMLNGVENRSPFLNKDLINFTLNYSEKKNFSLITEKKLMKDIFKNQLSKKFMKIKKHGFSFKKSLILKNRNLIERIIKKNYLTNINIFYKKYENYLKYNTNENYIWNELVLNLSRQNLEKKI